MLLLFVLLPLVEIALFVQIGGWLTLWPTLAIVVVTAVAGSWVVRRQGTRAMADLARAVDEMRDPARPMAEGAMILAAGVLLVLPGFFTDTLGITLLLPFVRALILRRLRARVVHARSGATMGRQHGAGARAGRGGWASGETIDGEYEDVTPGSGPQPTKPQGTLPPDRQH